MLVSEYYPEMFQRKRSVKDHEEWGRIKSMILLELMKGPDTRSGLKLKVNEQLKREGSLPISIKTVVRHLRNPDKTGLIDLGIVRERDGLLELSLTTPRKIAKFIDELSRNKTVGPRVSYFIDRIFAEAFYSAFGDRFANQFRIEEYIHAEIKKNLERFKVKEKLKLFELDLDIFVLIHFGGQKNSKNQINKKAIEIWEQLDVLSIILGASRKIRGELSTLFKVSYVLTVMDKLELALRLKIDNTLGDFINLNDFTVYRYDNAEILRFEPKDVVLGKFKNLLMRAISGEFRDDKKLKREYSILKIHELDTLVDKKARVYSKELARKLLTPINRKEVATAKEIRSLIELRKQKVLDPLPIFFLY